MKPLIIANWKMKLLPQEQERLARAFVAMAKNGQDTVSLVVCPSFESIGAVGRIFKGSPIALGAQDCFWEESGAYTGEVAPRALKKLGCSYVLIGHSERRVFLGETDEIVAKKVAAAYGIPGLQPILCIGESSAIRSSAAHLDFLKKQLTAGLRLVPRTKRVPVVVAYEPLWAISTAAQLVGTRGKPITADDCGEVYNFLKKILVRIRPASATAVLYGGSVDGGNALSFVRPGIADGALVGGASVHANEMKKIIHTLSGQ